jgi:hypothetical protein
MERKECKNLDLTQYKVLFVVVTAVLALLVASPALQAVLIYPRTEFFSELSLLGPGHMAENYPYNITRTGNYTIFLGVANQLGSCAYYQVEVKFRNETQSAPDDFNRTSSSLSSLYNVTAFVADKESLEIPLNFSFDYSFQNVTRQVITNITISQPGKNDTFEQRADNITLLQVNFGSLKLNDVYLNLQGYSSDWNAQKNEFYGNLVFELWMYNGTSDSFQYHERYVELKFNMTSNGMDNILFG